MLGAVAVMQQLAERTWQQMQHRAQQDLQVLEQAAARGLDAAAEKLADLAQPVDGKSQVPGYSLLQVVWEVSGSGAAQCCSGACAAAGCCEPYGRVQCWLWVPAGA